MPTNSFAEYALEPNPETKKKDVVWFAIDDSPPPFCFSGIWTTYNSDRGTKSKPVPDPRLDVHPADYLRADQVAVELWDEARMIAKFEPEPK